MKKNINLIASFIRFLPEKKKYLPVPIIFLFISNSISLIIPLLAMKVIDILKSDNLIDSICTLQVMFSWFSLLIVVALIEFFQSIRFKKYGNIIRQNFYNIIIKFHYKEHYNNWIELNSKEIADKIKKDIEDIIPLTSGSIFFIIRHILIVLITSILLVYINWKLAVGIALLLPFFIITLLSWGKKIKDTYRKYRLASEYFLADIIEFLQTIPLINLFNTFTFESLRLNNGFKWLINNELKHYMLVNKRQTFSKIISSITPVYLAFIAYIFIASNLATVGQIFAFWGLFSLTIGAVSGLSSLYTNLLNALVVFERLHNMFNNKIAKNIKQVPINTLESIQCNNINFSYSEDRTTTLSIPKLSLQKGKTTEIRGESGIGKTTLLKLIFGLLKPDNGEILINGIPINLIDKTHYLSKIGYVEQNGYIYSRSLKDNIALGREFDQSAWNNSISLAALDSFIRNLPLKQNQLLGENGLQVSGGERQRILIARALYHLPKWLFLDEPFIGIDESNQNQIEKLIQNISENITIVLITHQKKHLIKIDNIIEL